MASHNVDVVKRLLAKFPEAVTTKVLDSTVAIHSDSALLASNGLFPNPIALSPTTALTIANTKGYDDLQKLLEDYQRKVSIPSAKQIPGIEVKADGDGSKVEQEPTIISVLDK